MTKARLDADVLRYTLVSLHPGSDSSLNCVTKGDDAFAGVQVLVHDCAGAGDATAAWVHRLRGANDSLHNLVPGMRVTRLEVTLLPVGVESVLRVADSTPISQVHLKFAFRFRKDPRYLRHAVRAYAHEYMHLRLRAAGLEQLEDEEYVAAVAESCVEEKVFGTSVGPVFDDPSTFDVSRMTEAQRESVRSAARAYRDVLREIDRNGSLDHLCTKLFSSFPQQES